PSLAYYRVPLQSTGATRDLHSFPTRRSSDLSAATVAATRETATAGPTVFGDFMGGSFVARARHGGSAQRLHSMSRRPRVRRPSADRKSTRLNSSHVSISYAVFCLKKKKKHIQ